MSEFVSVGDVRFYIDPLNSKKINEAQKEYNKKFRECVESGCLLRRSLDKYMREQKLWDDSKESEYTTLVKKIADLEFKLNRGKIKVSEGREIALELHDTRSRLAELLMERNTLDSHTAEGQADNHRFNCLVALCVYNYDTKKPLYKDVFDYLDNVSTDLGVAVTKKFADYAYGIKDDDEKLTEYKFLKRFKMIDDKGRFIKDGKFIDRDGNYIDEEGNRVDEEGNRIDINNNPILESNVENAEFEEG